MDFDYPKLCGGTFFSLLINAKKPGTSKNAKRLTGGDGLTNADLLVALIKLFDPKYYECHGNTIKPRTSK